MATRTIELLLAPTPFWQSGSIPCSRWPPLCFHGPIQIQASHGLLVTEQLFGPSFTEVIISRAAASQLACVFITPLPPSQPPTISLLCEVSRWPMVAELQRCPDTSLCIYFNAKIIFFKGVGLKNAVSFFLSRAKIFSRWWTTELMEFSIFAHAMLIYIHWHTFCFKKNLLERKNCVLYIIEIKELHN